MVNHSEPHSREVFGRIGNRGRHNKRPSGRLETHIPSAPSRPLCAAVPQKVTAQDIISQYVGTGGGIVDDMAGQPAGTPGVKRSRDEDALGNDDKTPKKAALGGGGADLTSGRNKFWATMQRQIKQSKEKLVAEVKAGRAALANVQKAKTDHGPDEALDVFVVPVKERVSICEAVLVQSGTASGPGEDGIVVVDIYDSVLSADNADAKTLVSDEQQCDLADAAVLVALTKLELSPIESNGIFTALRWGQMLGKVRSVKSHEELSECEEQWASVYHLAGQLTTSTKTATKELLGRVKKLVWGAQKDKDKVACEESKKTREEKDKADATAKMSLVFQKDTKLFAADLGSRKTPVREITDEQLVAVRGPAAAVGSLESVFALPFCMRDSPLNKAMKGEGSSVVVETLKRWEDNFPTSAVFLKTGVILAPMLSAMGSDVASCSWDEVDPEAERIHPTVPSFQQKVSNT